MEGPNLFHSLSPEKKAEIDAYINNSMIGMGGSGIRDVAKYGMHEAPGLWNALKNRFMGEKPVIRPDVAPPRPPVVPEPPHPYPQAKAVEEELTFQKWLQDRPDFDFFKQRPGYGKGK